MATTNIKSIKKMDPEIVHKLKKADLDYLKENAVFPSVNKLHELTKISKYSIKKYIELHRNKANIDLKQFDMYFEEAYRSSLIKVIESGSPTGLMNLAKIREMFHPRVIESENSTQPIQFFIEAVDPAKRYGTDQDDDSTVQLEGKTYRKSK